MKRKVKIKWKNTIVKSVRDQDRVQQKKDGKEE